MKESTHKAFVAAYQQSTYLSLIADTLNAYESPAKEKSLAKGIPMMYRGFFKSRFFAYNLRIRYRGPRVKYKGRVTFNGRSNCLKEHANSFAVYVK